jgi:calcineurin-like phosphoesterase family protein
MTYFISDLHFGHHNIIKYCNRPFGSVEDMNKQIVDRWNQKITDDDTVYILGDIALSKDNVDKVKELKGKKHLIIGNHDYHNLGQIKKSKCFESVSYMKVITLDDKTITLCHFPTYSFIGDYMVYGHVHNNENDQSWLAVRTKPNMLNAGVEINKYVPATFKELQENNAKYLCAG